jgi:hypothetical protein
MQTGLEPEQVIPKIRRKDNTKNRYMQIIGQKKCIMYAAHGYAAHKRYKYRNDILYPQGVRLFPDNGRKRKD